MPSLKVGLQATIAYIAIVGIGMGVLHSAGNASDSPVTFDWLWIVELSLAALCIFYVLRHFGWERVGFGRLNWRALVWLLPSLILLVAIWLDLLDHLSSQGAGSIAWRVLALLTFTTFLIGFSEEVMFRGILLRSALASLPIMQAMLLSAGAFSLMHAFNGFGGQSIGNVGQQLAFTFLVGYFLAPMALKLGNLWPLIIWHWLWDLAIFSSQIFGVLHPYVLPGIMVQVVIGLVLWSEVARHD